MDVTKRVLINGVERRLSFAQEPTEEDIAFAVDQVAKTKPAKPAPKLHVYPAELTDRSKFPLPKGYNPDLGIQAKPGQAPPKEKGGGILGGIWAQLNDPGLKTFAQGYYSPEEYEKFSKSKGFGAEAKRFLMGQADLTSLGANLATGIGIGSLGKTAAKRLIAGLGATQVPGTIESARKGDWGGAAFKGTVAAIGMKSGLGKHVEPTATPKYELPEALSSKLTNIVKQNTEARKYTKMLYREERSQKAGALGGNLDAAVTADDFLRAQGALKGDLTKVPVENIGKERVTLDEPELVQIFRHINEHPALGKFAYTKNRAIHAVNKAITPGEAALQPSEIDLIRGVLGPKVATALGEISKLDAARRGIAEVVNVPRAIMSSFDLSAPFRQGLVLTTSHPIRAAQAFVSQLKAFGSERGKAAVDDYIVNHPLAEVIDRSPLYLAGIKKAGGIDPKAALQQFSKAQGEEAFQSTLAEKIPIIGKGVKASERAYTSYLNKLRVDVFADNYNRLQKRGLADDATVDGLARYINMATGRGSLGPAERVAPELSTLLFSPRLMASRIQLLNPVTYAKLPAGVRGQAAKDMAVMFSVGMSVLAVAKSNGAKVETDARSSDFGKIKMGKTRLDIWGGFQQYMRLMRQVQTGQIKPVSGKNTGSVKPTSRWDQVFGEHGFLRGKLAPGVAAPIDLAVGTNVVGEKRTPADLWKYVAPLYVQDAYEAIQSEGLIGAVKVAPGLVGVGTQTFGEK